MGILIPLPEDTFTIGRREVSRSYIDHNEYEVVYYNDMYVDEDTRQLYVHVSVSDWPIHHYLRVKYDEHRKYKSGRWGLELMEFIEPENRGSDKNTYYKPSDKKAPWDWLNGRFNTPLAAHRAALNYLMLLDKEERALTRAVMYTPWYCPPQIR